MTHLNEWLHSSTRLREILPEDLLVLASHQTPFYGLHVRLNQLIEGHNNDLTNLFDYLEEPRRTNDTQGVNWYQQLLCDDRE